MTAKRGSQPRVDFGGANQPRTDQTVIIMGTCDMSGRIIIRAFREIAFVDTDTVVIFHEPISLVFTV
jgi:hypothetical protein